ncbi:MAG: MotA/TolQ/ExbB proton channel family protein [Clostridiales bacterium]|nr:MotA/TolQ/ExbB proton channel family protein [Clostridiales bacterium]
MPTISSFPAGLMNNLVDILVYAAIAIVTLIGVGKCLLPLTVTTRALRRAIRRMQQDAGTRQGTPVWQEKRFMGNRLKGSWLRFLQNAEQLDRRGLPCNVEDYINDDTVAHGPGNAPLAELIPSLLTSLGILGTFMGMMRGLSGLDFSNADAIIEGIPVLLSGMRFAFGTSVAGVCCSIVFNMLNRILQGSAYRAIDDFVECFTSLAMQRPLDNDVQLICQNQDSNHMLSSLTEILPGQLASAMEGSVARAMSPVAKAMDNFLVGATRAQVDGVGRIVGAFVQQMNLSLSDQFVQLGRTMTEINQNQQLTMEHIRQSMAAANTIVADVKQLHAVSNDVISHFEQYVRELGDARHRDETFEQSAASLLEKMQQMSAEQTRVLQQVSSSNNALLSSINAFSAENEKALTRLQHNTSVTGEHLDKVAISMDTAGQELSQSCQSFVQNVVSGLSQAMGLFDQNMTTLVATLTAQIDRLNADGTSEATAAATAEMQKLLTELKQHIPAKEV